MKNNAIEKGGQPTVDGRIRLEIIDHNHHGQGGGEKSRVEGIAQPVVLENEGLDRISVLDLELR